MNKIEEMLTKIDTSKEVLSALPKNNKKNLTIYMNKLKELSDEYSSYKDVILTNMEKKYNKFNKEKDNDKTDELKKQIKNHEDKIHICNKYTTAFEKMNLDKAINNLNHYYINDLKVVNESILYILKKFKEVGINLKDEEFFYNKYVMDYISLFFDDMDSGKFSTKQLNSKFEEIYWKCPDIIIYIELNFRYLFNKYEKTLNQYYTKDIYELLENTTYERLIERYSEIRKEEIEEIKNNKYAITKELMDGKLKVSDYKLESINKIYKKFVDAQTIENCTQDEQDEIDDNLFKLINSVREYKNYLKFKFIIDDIINIYNEKEKYKNAYKDKKKEIVKNEHKIFKLSKKIQSKNLFNNSHDKEKAERNKIIFNTKDLYKDLDDYRVYNVIINKLNDSSTLSDVIHLASSFYIFLFHIIRKQYETEYSQEDIEDLIADLKRFDKWPYKTFLMNLTITEEKDIVFIIKDRYRLLNLNIEKEDLKEENLENLINSIHKIQISYCIRKNKIDLKEIENEIEIKKYINQNIE